MIPNGTRFIGIATSVDLVERKSAVLNKTTEPFTIEDIAEFVGPGEQGPIGPQGEIGLTGAPGAVGPAGLEWRGEWESGTSYIEDDAVGNNNGSYFCILATDGTIEPYLDPTHWALLALQGAVGPAGEQGPIGPQGPGAVIGPLTSGSVLFSNGTTIAQDNPNFFWNDTNNRLGILTTSPQVPLHVIGSIRAADATGLLGINLVPANNSITIGDVYVAELSGSTMFYGGNQNFLHLRTSSTTRLYIDNVGKIGIGTIAPTKRLHIYGEAANDSGLRLERLTSSSPTSTGQAIGVDANGNVVTVSGGYYNSINASEEVSTTSLTDVVVTGMTITPPAGTYKVDFNGNYDVIPGNVCTIATLDLQNMYLALLNTPATGTHGLTFGSGETITAGVYTVSGAMSVAGTLTLDGGGDPNALFIFRVTGAINTAIATTIQLSNSANAANVFFMAIGAVGIGADNVVSGNFIAYGAAAALGANCIFNGRLFSTSGALAFSSGIQSKPTAISVINMGILENFLCFTNQGNVANTALAVITGDMGTNFGNVTIFATSIFNGNAYDDTQQLGSTNMFSIYNGNTMVPNSSRLRRYYTYTEDVALTCVTTVDGTQPISINWRTDVGRCILNNRILTIVKL
jgi:hypothetical protein